MTLLKLFDALVANSPTATTVERTRGSLPPALRSVVLALTPVLEELNVMQSSMQRGPLRSGRCTFRKMPNLHKRARVYGAQVGIALNQRLWGYLENKEVEEAAAISEMWKPRQLKFYQAALPEV